MESDDEEDDEKLADREDDVEIKDEKGNLLSPEEARRQGELAEGVQKIKLKRQHSAEPLGEPSATRKSPYLRHEEDSPAGTPASVKSTSANAGTPPDGSIPALRQESLLDTIGSPFKKHRASMPGLESGTFAPLGSTGPDAPFAPGSEATET